MEIEQHCKHHGMTIFTKRKDGLFKCKKCCTEAVQKRRELLKTKAIEYMGGACKKCGYNRCRGSLVFHHIDPTQKDFAISSKGYTRSWEKVKNELDKCVLLCANCHGEVHEEIDKLKLRNKIHV